MERNANAVTSTNKLCKSYTNGEVHTAPYPVGNGQSKHGGGMADAGLSCGDASYHFKYTDTICVTQEDSSIEFEIEINKDQLTIFFMGQEYLTLQK